MHHLQLLISVNFFPNKGSFCGWLSKTLSNCCHVVSYRHETCLQIQISHHHDWNKTLTGEIRFEGWTLLGELRVASHVDEGDYHVDWRGFPAATVPGEHRDLWWWRGQNRTVRDTETGFLDFRSRPPPDVTPNFDARRTRSRKLSEQTRTFAWFVTPKRNCASESPGDF